jgi:hypothetical protein
MLSLLTFREEGVVFNISEVTTEEKVTFEIETLDDDFGFQKFDIGVNELITLRKWIDDQISFLNQQVNG